MKNAVLPLAVGVAVFALVLAVFANLNSSKLTKALDGERFKRLTAEEQLQKAHQQIAGLQSELGDVKSKMSSIDKILNDGKEIAKELEAVKKDRETLKKQIESLQIAAETAVETAVPEPVE